MPPWKSGTAVCSNRRDDEPSPLGETANASSQNLASMVQKRRSLWKRDSALDPVSCCATLRQIDEDRQAQARVLALLSSAEPLFILRPIVCVRLTLIVRVPRAWQKPTVPPHKHRYPWPYTRSYGTPAHRRPLQPFGSWCHDSLTG